MHAIRQDDECQWIVRTVRLDRAGVDPVAVNIALAEKLAEYETLDVALKGMFRVHFTVEAG